MKLGHMFGLAVVAYFVVTGVNEFLSTDNATISSLPDWGAVVGSTAGTSSPVAAGLDLATAAAVYFFFLHGKL
jgi:hypothetical protein